MSANNTTETEHGNAVTTPAIPTPDSKPETASKEPVTGTMVIPVILIIVLAVVVVSTFFDDEYNKLLELSDEVVVSEMTAYDESSDNTSTPDTTVAETKTPIQPVVAVTDTAAKIPDHDTESAPLAAATGFTAENTGDDDSAASPVAKSAEPSSPASPDSTQVSGPYYNPYYASPDFGTPYQPYAYPESKEQREMIAQQRKIWEEIEDRRRRNREEMAAYRRQAWLDAETARREHLANMHDIRTAVLKRIEQDRNDMNRQIQEMNEEMNRRREQTDRRMMEFRRGTDWTKI